MGKRLNLLMMIVLVALWAALTTGCTDTEAKGEAATPPPPPVKAMTVQARDIPLTFEYAAQVEGSREVEVRAQVSGILQERTYMEGTFVHEGDVLFRIAPGTYDANLEKAQGELERLEANLELSRLELDRTVALFDQGVVSTQERDDAVSQYEAARAAVRAAQGSAREARINLGYTEVTAPISGITSRETRSEGSLITLDAGGSLLTTITRLNPVYVNFSVPGTEILKRRRMINNKQMTIPEDGMIVHLRLSDGSVYEHAGRINFTDKQEDPQTGSVRTRAEVSNPEGMILPGGFVRVILSGAVLTDAVVVPQRAIMFTQQSPLVFVLGDDNVPKARPVQLGDTVGDDFQILGGVKPGERIVSEGVMQIRQGSPVSILPSESNSAKGSAPNDGGNA